MFENIFRLFILSQTVVLALFVYSQWQVNEQRFGEFRYFSWEKTQKPRHHDKKYCRFFVKILKKSEKLKVAAEQCV